MPSKKSEAAAAVESAVEATVQRVRRRLGFAAVFIHGHGVIEPGQYTDAISIDEARQRADFEVVNAHDEHSSETPAADPAPEEEPDGLSESR